jgi:hypothetical protein
VIGLPKKLDIKPGDRFSRLTIIKEVEQRNKARFFLCRCDCGVEKEIRLALLRNGHTKSCGCLKRDHLISMTYKNGQSRTKLYSIWRSMKQRCLNSNSQAYDYYGGRGIKVCEEWMDFEIFQNWAVNNGYKEGLTIERIDNDGNYEPSNCKWIPQSKQSNNTRRNRVISYKNKQQNLKQWSEELKINRHTLFGRLKRGWTVPKAFETPVDIKCRNGRAKQ